MIQTVTYNELDNTFFEVLRRAVVAAGYLPNILSYQTGTLAQRAAAYKQAKVTLRDSIGTITEIFNTGSFESKGEKTINKIVIVRGAKKLGSIGGWPATQIDVTTGLPLTAESRFKKSFTPDASNNVSYEVRLITNDAVWDNTLSSVIDNAIPQKRFINTVGNDGLDTNNRVLVVSNGDTNISAFNFIERIFRFTVMDVFVQSGAVTKTNIPVLSTVDFMVYLTQEIIEGAQSALPGTLTPTPRTVTLWITDTPDEAAKIAVGRGQFIQRDYLPGSSITIPYLAENNTVESPIFVSNHTEQLLKCIAGVIDYHLVSVDANFVSGDYVTLKFTDYV